MSFKEERISILETKMQELEELVVDILRAHPYKPNLSKSQKNFIDRIKPQKGMDDG